MFRRVDGTMVLLALAFVAGAAAIVAYNIRHAHQTGGLSDSDLAKGEVTALILAHYKERKKPPTSLEDLTPFAARYPNGYRHIATGSWIVLWGTPLDVSHRAGGNADRLLAYQNDRPVGERWYVFGELGADVMEEGSDAVKEMIERSTVLHGIFDMYMAYYKDHKAPPVKKSDLELYAADYDQAFRAIDIGRWVVQWGTPVGDDVLENSSTVLAYARRGPGGDILAADGIVYAALDWEVPGWLESTPIAREIARMYLNFHRDHKKPPARPGDLRPYAAQYPGGFAAIEKGRWVVVWGTEISSDPKENRKRLLAYDSRAPTADVMSRYWAVFADRSSCTLGSYDFRDKSWERSPFPRTYPD